VHPSDCARVPLHTVKLAPSSVPAPAGLTTHGFRHIPVGIVSSHLAKIADVAHVVPFTGLLHIFPVHDFAGPVLDVTKRLKDGAGIVTTTTTIVDLCTPRGPDEPPLRGS
jgi:hypothetical protein